MDISLSKKSYVQQEHPESAYLHQRPTHLVLLMIAMTQSPSKIPGFRLWFRSPPT